MIKVIVNYYVSFSSSSEFLKNINYVFRNYLNRTKEIRANGVFKSDSNQIELSLKDSSVLKNEYNKLVSGLKKEIPNVLKYLKAHIENETKSDSKIIDLI